MQQTSYGKRDNDISVSKDEAALGQEVAKRKGLGDDAAAELLVKAAIARRVKKRTGKSPAKVYMMRRK